MFARFVNKLACELNEPKAKTHKLKRSFNCLFLNTCEVVVVFMGELKLYTSFMMNFRY